MSDNDAGDFGRCLLQSLTASIQLPLMDPPVRDVSIRRGCVEPDNDGSVNRQDRIELLADMFPVEPVRIEESLSDPVKRHIVVSRDDKLRHGGETFEEFRGRDELLFFGPLGEIPAHNNCIGFELLGRLQQRFADDRKKRRAKMQIRDLKNPQ